MRSLIPLSLLAACATTGVQPSPETVRGCWIERRGAETLTLRAFPERSERRVWRLDLMLYTPGEEPAPQLYRIEPAAAGWRICLIEEPHGPPCRDAFFGPGVETAENGGEWMELRAARETLHFTYHVAGERFVFFAGARDGCD